MEGNTHSPRIVQLTWGRIETEAGRIFTDAKLWPGGGTHWDWSLTGTCHRPGIQVADVEEVVAHGARVLVLSCGVYQRLKVSCAALAFLEKKKIKAHVLPTQNAADLYNELALAEPVGGLFHSTC